MFGISEYNYKRFRRGEAPTLEGAPEPGDEAPDFELRSIDGERCKLSDFAGKKNVVITFGSATCPQTAASIGGFRDLADEFSDHGVQFLFIYVREKHPGDELPAHRTHEDKVAAAQLLAEEEDIEFPVLVDELNGKVHKKYGTLPNATFVVDRSGRIAYRSLASRTRTLGEALEDLLERQKDRGVEHVIVGGGEDATVPSFRRFVHAYRALERGGDEAIANFRKEMGMPGRMQVLGSRIAGPVAEHPKASVATVMAAAGVIGLGIYLGMRLRRSRFASLPYRYNDVYQKDHKKDPEDYDAVGI